MVEFVIAILVALSPDGRPVLDSAAFATYSECLAASEVVRQNAEALGFVDVRTACIPSGQIGQGGA